MADFHSTRKEILIKKLTWNEYKKVFHYVISIINKGLSGIDFFLIVLSCFIGIAYGFMVPIVTGAITNYAVMVYNGTNTAIVILISLVVLLPFLKAMTVLMSYINTKITLTLIKHLDISVKSSVIDKLAHIKLDYFNDPIFSEKQYFINLKATEQFGYIVTAAMDTLSAIAGAISSFIVIFANYPLAAFICTIGIIPLAFLSNSTSRNLYFFDYWEIPEYKRMGYAFEISSSGKYAQERILYDYAPAVEQRFDQAYRELKKLRDRAAQKLALNRILSNFFTMLALAVVLLMVSHDIFSASLNIGLFSLMLSAVQAFSQNAQAFFNNVFRLKLAANYGKSIIDIQEFEDEPIEFNNTTTIDSANIDIEICGLHFKYPGMDEEVLKGINLKIRQGEKIVIVGKNGCGKSTLVSLLMGMYPPSSGEIYISGVPLRDCLESTRRSTACIFQKFNQYEMSIADNILVGDLTREVPREELEALCDKLGISEFARNFPNGIDTILGSTGEEGANLSGGQWQRVMMARALIRKNASLLIFDEPTAALDPKAEAALYSEFASITGERTTLIISHRLGITNAVDRILVMDDGQIVEDGTHDELMANNALYAKMWGAQAQWYE